MPKKFQEICKEIHDFQKSNQYELVKKLVADNIETVDENGDNILNFALKNTGETTIYAIVKAVHSLYLEEEENKFLLEKDKKLTIEKVDLRGFVNQKNSDESTVLHNAVNLELFAIVELLCEMGSSYNLKDKDGYTAIHYAAMKGNYDLFKLLKRNGADAEHVDNEGNTSLHLVLAQDINLDNSDQYVKIIRNLADAESLSIQNNKGNNPFDILNNNKLINDSMRQFLSSILSENNICYEVVIRDDSSVLSDVTFENIDDLKPKSKLSGYVQSFRRLFETNEKNTEGGSRST